MTIASVAVMLAVIASQYSPVKVRQSIAVSIRSLSTSVYEASDLAKALHQAERSARP